MQQHPEQGPRPTFDPHTALEELERFGRDIQRYRAQREALGDEFETFVRSFKTAGAAAPAVPAAELTPPPPAPVEAPVVETAAPVPDDTPLVPAVAASAPPAAEIVAPPIAEEPPSIPVAMARPPARPPIGMVAAGVAIVLGGGLLAAYLWNRSPEPVGQPASPDTAAAAAPVVSSSVPPPAAGPAPAAPAAVAPGGDAVIATDRKVWMRVIVDGAKLLEREVPAGTTIPIKADKTIVIRTGDAGAVRLSIRGGPPTPLGREGVVVTRSFTVPPRSEAAR